MADCQTNLYEPAQDLILTEGCLGLLSLTDALGEIAALCVLHDDVQPSLGCSVYFSKADDVGVSQQLEDLGFPHGICLLLWAEISKVNLLYCPFLPSGHLANEKGPPIAATAQQTDTLVNIALPL